MTAKCRSKSVFATSSELICERMARQFVAAVTGKMTMATCGVLLNTKEYHKVYSSGYELS